MTDILKRLETRFDPRIVQPDELARDAHAEIRRLRSALEEIIIEVPECDIHYQGTVAINIASKALNG